MNKIEDAQVYLPDLWATHARFSPGKETVICGETRRNWGDFDRNMNKVANAVIARVWGDFDRNMNKVANAVIARVWVGVTRSPYLWAML